jgi:glycosyltransferase domain-containing protein
MDEVAHIRLSKRPQPASTLALPRLTVVLPLKGRHLFTLRFLWHANKLRLPYHFLIADGQVNESVARYLENSCDAFPHLNIEYARYPDDINYTHFFAKMCDAVGRVRTPYAMFADNDDFLGFSGIERALDFLDHNADYIAAHGQPIAFSVYSGRANLAAGVHGRLNSFRTTYECADFSAPDVIGRLRQGTLPILTYYAIYRTEALATISRETVEIDFSDLMLHEIYHALRTLTLGKVHANKATITYLWEIGTSLSHDPLKDWARHLLRSRFTSDVHGLVARISSAAISAGANAAVVDEEVRTLIEAHFRNFLSTNYGSVMQFKRFIRKRWPNSVKYWQSRPRFSVGRERAALISKLADAGASEEELNRMRGELDEISATLSLEAFTDYAGPLLKMLRPDGRRTWV